MSVVVHWVEEVGDGWGEILGELTRCFEATRSAAQRGDSVVYLVHGDDLLGRRGAGRAMVATGLLSAARTAAMEGVKEDWTVNVVAYPEGADREAVEAVASSIEAAVTGELIRIGPAHLGKALP